MNWTIAEWLNEYWEDDQENRGKWKTSMSSKLLKTMNINLTKGELSRKWTKIFVW